MVAAPGSGAAPAPRTAAASPAAPGADRAASISAWRSPSPAVHGVRWSSVAGHLHAKLPPVEQSAVHRVHGIFGVALVEEAHESKAAALLRVPVAGDVHVAHAPVLLEHAAKGLRRGSVRQVIHFEGGHPLHVWWRPTVTHFL